MMHPAGEDVFGEFECGHALGTVARASERDEQRPRAAGQAQVRAAQELGGRDRLDAAMQARKERGREAIADEGRGAGTRQHDPQHRVGDERREKCVDPGPLCGHEACQLHPDGGLLRDLAGRPRCTARFEQGGRQSWKDGRRHDAAPGAPPQAAM